MSIAAMMRSLARGRSRNRKINGARIAKSAEPDSIFLIGISSFFDTDTRQSLINASSHTSLAKIIIAAAGYPNRIVKARLAMRVTVPVAVDAAAAR